MIPAGMRACPAISTAQGTPSEGAEGVSPGVASIVVILFPFAARIYLPSHDTTSSESRRG